MRRRDGPSYARQRRQNRGLAGGRRASRHRLRAGGEFISRTTVETPCYSLVYEYNFLGSWKRGKNQRICRSSACARCRRTWPSLSMPLQTQPMALLAASEARRSAVHHIT